MKNLLVITFLLLASLHTVHAQQHRYFKMLTNKLNSELYDEEKGNKSLYLKLDEEGAKKILGDSITYWIQEESGQSFMRIDSIRYRNNTVRVFDGYDTGLVGYYPELNLMTTANCNGDYVINMENGEWFEEQDDPQYDRISPSGQYRITFIDGDMGVYHLDEKIDGEYQRLGVLKIHQYDRFNGLYWADENEIHFRTKDWESGIYSYYYGRIVEDFD